MNIARCKVLEMTQKGMLTIAEADELLELLGENGNTAVSPTTITLDINDMDWLNLHRAASLVTTLLKGRP